MGRAIFVVTAAAQYLNQGLSELQEADGSVRAVKLPGNGIAVIETEQDKAGFIENLKKKKPVFIRHMNSVDFILDAEGEPDGMAERIRGYGKRLSGKRTAVQVRKCTGDKDFEPIDAKSAADAVLIELGAVPEIKEPERIISVLYCDGKCYIGLGTPEENISAWSGGMMHFRKSVEDISRARYKLMEAMKVFDIDMEGLSSALDLGAAPGGWTSVLLEHGLKVTAVDTGDMDERLYRYSGLRYIKANAAELDLEKESFDMLTSDMSWNPKNTARIIAGASQYLKAGGVAVVTLKLMGDKVRRTVREVLAIYEELFEVLGVRQLFHNRDEVTVYLRKK
ncbi:MAG TPA: SAM-dependent methyltransferase [Clostridia bacterium]|nr:SAM-dependent methyltransferase [Clostridia bacterium]